MVLLRFGVGLLRLLFKALRGFWWVCIGVVGLFEGSSWL